jgi:hypothetical protein
MKKIILLIILFFLFSASECDKEQPNAKYTFEKTYNYNQEAQSIKDVYVQLKLNRIDSIPMSRWMTAKFNKDEGYVLQSLLLVMNDSLRYDFIYTTFIFIDSARFQFKVRKTSLK